MQNIAAIDVGSNALRMAVGRVDNTGRVEVIETIRLPVRLGADAFARRSLGDAAVHATVEAFQRFRKTADDFGVAHVRAVATSALREAVNRDHLVEQVSRTTGIRIQTIGSAEESRLIHLAVRKTIDLRSRRAVLIDIGGGSVEMAMSRAERLIAAESFDLGAVRLLGKFGSEDPRVLVFSRLVEDYAESARRQIERELGPDPVDVCIGTGGNVEEMGTLAARWFGEQDNSRVTLTGLSNLIDALSAMSLEDRIMELHLQPDRADVILPASIVLRTLAGICGLREILIPRVGLKDGLLWMMAAELTGSGRLRRSHVWPAALRLGHKYEFDHAHGARVASFARRLFDQSRDLHGLDDEYRILLEVAALLHDVGHFVSTIDHDRHGFYILRHNLIMGLDPQQQLIVANLVRCHRRLAIKLDDPELRELDPSGRLLVSKLLPLLRIADAADCGHANHVRDLDLKRERGEWVLRLRSRGDPSLERWSLLNAREAFQAVLGEQLKIR